MKIIKRNQENPVARREFRDAFADLYNRFFDDEFFSTDLLKSGWNPKIDVYEKDQNVIVKADIPGIDEKNLNVDLEANVLTVSGTKEEEHETKEKNYQRVERSYGSFCRSISLPEGIEADKVTADYKKGVLTVTIPRSKESETKKISVKVS